jgi:hypothetical protein
VAIAPVILLAALSYHPYLPGRQPNIDASAAAVTSDPTRWGIVHMATRVASAVLAVAFLAIRSHLHEVGEDRWSAAALPFVVIGSTLYAMLPAMEFGPLATSEAGGDVEAAQEALIPWFIPLLVAAAVTFGIGMVGFAISVSQSGLLSLWPTRLVAIALVVMALSRVVPLSAVQFYVHGVAALAAMLPLAYSMWKHPTTPAPVTHRAVKSST